MNNKKIAASKEIKTLKQRSDYKKTIKFVKKFTQQQKNIQHKRIKINSYGDFPWFPRSTTASEEWNTST